MADAMIVPASFDEFAEEYKIVDSKEVYTNGAKLIPIFRVKQWLEHQPTADVVEVKHGEWILTKTELGWNCSEYPSEYTCSVCGRTEKHKEPYCHCGAKMDVSKMEITTDGGKEE